MSASGGKQTLLTERSGRRCWGARRKLPSRTWFVRDSSHLRLVAYIRTFPEPHAAECSDAPASAARANQSP